MKRSVVILTVSLFFNVSSAPSSSAIFGLSKCEKVKKEILSKENKINTFIKKVRVNSNNIISESSARKITQFHQKSYIQDIWKLAYNNPKCFTNTQKLQIEQLPKLSLPGYINFYDYGEKTREGICRDLEMYYLDERCIKVHKYTIVNFFLFDSLYSY